MNPTNGLANTLGAHHVFKFSTYCAILTINDETVLSEKSGGGTEQHPVVVTISLLIGPQS